MMETLLTPPNLLPVSLTEIKETLRIVTNREDERLTSLIKASTAWVEGLTGKAMIAQTRAITVKVSALRLWQVRQQREVFSLRLPTLPLIEVLEVSFNGTPINAFRVEESRFVELPTLKKAGEIRIVNEVGFGNQRDDVPAGLRQVIIMATARFYEQLTFPTEGEVRSLIAPYTSTRLH